MGARGSDDGEAEGTFSNGEAEGTFSNGEAEGTFSNGEAEGTVFPGFEALADDAEALIADLVELRRRRGLSQTEIATRMGTSQSALARMESGRSDLRLSTVARYAEALEVDLAFAIRSRSAGSGREAGGRS